MPEYGRRPSQDWPPVQNSAGPSPNDPTFWTVFNQRTDPLPLEDDLPRRGGSEVYFLHFPELRRVKIGFTTNLHQRKIALKSQAAGLECQHVGSLDGGRLVEGLMHERFAEHRISGEWYDECIIPEARELISADQQHFGD